LSKDKKLTPVQIWDFNIIPEEIFRQLKKGDFYDYNEKDLERLYALGQFIGQDQTNFIYALVNKEKKIKGVLWLAVDLVTLHLWITLLIIDKEYQKYKANMQELYQFIKGIQKQYGLKKIRALVRAPRTFEKLFGAKKSKSILMEVE